MIGEDIWSVFLFNRPDSAAKKFVLADHVKPANIGWMGENFKRLFLRKVEEDVPKATLTVSKLTNASLDAPILTELGDRAESKLAWLFELIEKQSKGEDGILLTNGYANIFYVLDADGNLWAVYAYWYSDCRDWSVEAYSVERPDRWNAGNQVFSCDS